MELEQINNIGTDLIRLLKLKTSPIAVALVSDESEIPDDIERINGPLRHCQMVDKVRKEGKQFYSLVDDQQCKGGAAVMGMQEMPAKLASGETYYGLGRFENLESAKHTMEQVPTLPAGSTKGVIYGPLDKITFKPDVVLIIDTPKKAMQLSQALIHHSGGRVNASFAGIQSVCADGVVFPHKEQIVSATLGCGGSRKFANIGEDEMILGIPADKLPELAEAAEKMFG
ncbi:uncharacterized protein (DUF169 family) [Methanohalophilus levihalophilus]|uniref:DUF169 domain-containing protein n=1 Tax=Methanohalophilus levihalophilus TaxID=1431282 RepID=UPI001AE4E7F1|nr:DUF169 domain-containing protein [Methanohalophilus levihalophilus]MBP2029455.1 uncharacterized protein (DUF169 family) [Methanohalophilus levihalophilus]